MSMLVFTPNRNTKKADYSGVFLPGARRFLAHHGAPSSNLHELPLQANQQTKPGAMLDLISASQDLEVLALFCHGFFDHIQLGFSLRTVRKLAAALGAVARKDLRVILYACSTGRAGREQTNDDATGGEGGFADALRDALCLEGLHDCQVDAHATAGHALWNPHVRRFRGEGSPVGGQGGAWIVQPSKRPLWKPWRSALRTGTFAFDFPFMNVGEIHSHLLAIG